MTKRGQKAALEELRKQVPAGAWEFYERMFEMRLGDGEVSEDDFLSYMTECLQGHARRIAARDRQRVHNAALYNTAEYQERQSDLVDDDARYERYRADAAKHFNKLVKYEVGGHKKPRDPAYPRAEAERLVATALVDCTHFMERVLPREVVDLAEHLLLRRRARLRRNPRDGTTTLVMNPEADDYMLFRPRSREFYAAANYLALNPEAGDREVAKEVGVTDKTIKHWKTEEHFVDYQACYLREVRTE